MNLRKSAILLAALSSLSLGAAASHAEMLEVWWNKGFYPAEDRAIQNMVKKWEAKTGNQVSLTFYSTSDIPAKIVSAITAGVVPDVAYADTADFSIASQQAWNDRLTDLSDVVGPIESKYTKTALLAAHLYDNVAKKRAYYAVPIKQQALHNFYWRPLLEKAGFKASDIPAEWGDYWKFWEKVQDKLRDQGMRVYALGFPMSTVDTDNFYTFNQFMMAYGPPIVDESGQFQGDKPEVRKAAIDAITFMTEAYKAGYVPSSAINWGDPDNNSAFYAKQVVMTPNASLSIPVAKKQNPQLYGHDIVTTMQPQVGGKPMTSLVAVKIAIVPKGAKHVDLAKSFLAFLTEPDNLDQYLSAAQGRWFPVMPEIIKKNPFWTDQSDPHIPVAAKQELELPTRPWPQSFNPAYAEVNAREVWGKAEGEVLVGGKTPEQAVDAAIQQIKDIFAQYPIPKE
jgi:multiple sugar transport system substrate-binding protein